MTTPFSPEAKQQLSRELGRRRIQNALKYIEQAQILLSRAAEELSPILGGAPQWRRGGKLYDQVKAFWYVVEELGETLEKRGGPLVDDVNLNFAISRLVDGGKSEQKDSERPAGGER